MLSTNAGTECSNADLTQPSEVLTDPAVERLDFTRPLVLLQCLTLHPVPDDTEPVGPHAPLHRRAAERVVGSAEHLSNPADGSESERIAAAMEHAMRGSSMGTGWFRSREDIATMLPELKLLDPGLVPLDAWWPSGPRTPAPSDPVALGTLGYKP